MFRTPHRRRHHSRRLPPPPGPHPRRRRSPEPVGAVVQARLFHMANDSGLFQQPDDLADADFDGWSYHRERHRVSCRCTRRRCSATSTTASPPTATPPRPSSTSARCPARPTSSTTTRTWSRSPATGSTAPRSASSSPARWDRDWLLGWRDIARASDDAHLRPVGASRPAPSATRSCSRSPPNREHGPLLHAVVVVAGVRLRRAPEAQRHAHEVLHRSSSSPAQPRPPSPSRRRGSRRCRWPSG